MKNIFISIFVLLAVSGYAQAETLYRWVDKDGKVHYGDRPAEDAVAAEQKKFSAPPATDDDGLSYGMRKARQNFPVTLYLSPGCGDACTQARIFLNKRGVPFVEKNLATQEDIKAFKEKTGGNTVPVLMVGKSQLSGFGAEQWNSELDIAGYPRTAPYGSRPVPPAAPKSEPTPAEAAP